MRPFLHRAISETAADGERGINLTVGSPALWAGDTKTLGYEHFTPPAAVRRPAAGGVSLYSEHFKTKSHHFKTFRLPAASFSGIFVMDFPAMRAEKYTENISTA